MGESMPIGSRQEAGFSREATMAEQANVAIHDAAVVGGESRRRQFRERLFGDRIFGLTTTGLALIVLALLIALAIVLIEASLPALHQFGLRFLISTDWDPVNDIYGALPFIYGTAVSSALALTIAVPLSLGVALCLSELCAGMASKRPIAASGRVARCDPQRRLWTGGRSSCWVPGCADHIDPVLKSTAAGFPSDVSGAAYLSKHVHRTGVILAVMVIPYIASVCTDVFAVIPQSQREWPRLALGAGTKWEMVRLCRFCRPPSQAWSARSFSDSGALSAKLSRWR